MNTALFQLSSGLNTLPSRGDLDEYTVSCHAFPVIKLNELFCLLDGA